MAVLQLEQSRVFWDCRAARVHLFCKFTILCLWLRGWGSGCVGRVGPIKDSFNLPPQFSRLGIQGPAPHYLSVVWCMYVLCRRFGGFLVSFFSF